MKIAILGLAGDPPHNGHKAVMQLAARYVDEVWLMPCYLHKFKNPIASPENRLAMCNLFGKVSDYEIIHKFCGYTFDIVNNLKKDMPQHEFSFVIGQDNADHIDTWYNWQELIKLIRFIVVPRGNVKSLKNWYWHDNHIFADNVEQQDCSSTKIRELIKNNKYEEAAVHLDPKVLRYIKDNELYVNNYS
jgi:nicotinate-nucleotide adenylyltransferase